MSCIWLSFVPFCIICFVLSQWRHWWAPLLSSQLCCLQTVFIARSILKEGSVRWDENVFLFRIQFHVSNLFVLWSACESPTVNKIRQTELFEVAVHNDITNWQETPFWTESTSPCENWYHLTTSGPRPCSPQTFYIFANFEAPKWHFLDVPHQDMTKPHVFINVQ